MTMARVMVVDDDVTVREVVVTYLRAAGYDVGEAADGESALAELRDERADLVVLDLMLPGIDGLEVCRRIRAKGDEVPVIMLTALGSETDRVVGLERGADDYVTKPFSPRELVLRVESVLRRVGERGVARGSVSDGDRAYAFSRGDIDDAHVVAGDVCGVGTLSLGVGRHAEWTLADGHCSHSRVGCGVDDRHLVAVPVGA